VSLGINRSRERKAEAEIENKRQSSSLVRRVFHDTREERRNKTGGMLEEQTMSRKLPKYTAKLIEYALTITQPGEIHHVRYQPREADACLVLPMP